MDGMNQAMTNDLKLKELEAQMDQLGKASATIRKVFSDVASSFQAVYYNSNHEEFNFGLRKLQIRWDDYKAVFNGIEIKAKKLTSEAHVVANDFATDFADYLGDPDEPVSAKKEEIKKYKTYLKADEEESTKIKADLYTLEADLVAFSTDWQELAKTEETSIEPKAKARDDKITSLNTQIDELKLKITINIVALGASLGVAVNALILTGLLKDRDNLEGQRDGIQKELDQLKAQRARIQALQLTGTNSVENDTKKAKNELRAFQDVWQELISDLSDVVAALDLIGDDQLESKKLAHSRIRTIANMYKTAAVAMKYYSSKT